MLTIEELGKQVYELKELLAKAKPSENEDKRIDELIKQVAELEQKIHPPERKMIWAVPDKEGKVPENGMFFADVLRAVANPIQHLDTIAQLKTVLNETTGSQGGYTVPEEFANEIIQLEAGESILRRIARLFPMGSLIRRVPQQLTDVTVTWTDEAVAKTPTKPTFGRVTQTAHKVAAVVKMTDELLADNSVGLDNFCKELVANAMGREEDRCGLVGNTDPFVGVLNAVGVNAVLQVGANLAADDLVNLIFGIGAGYRAGASLVMSSHALRLISTLKDNQNRPLWQMPNESRPGNVYGMSYEVSDQILSTYGAGAETAILYGNWKKYLWLSDRGGYEIYASKDASDFGTNESAFMLDETWFRFVRRMSINVALPVAFSRMLVK